MCSCSPFEMRQTRKSNAKCGNSYRHSFKGGVRRSSDSPWQDFLSSIRVQFSGQMQRTELIWLLMATQRCSHWQPCGNRADSQTRPEAGRCAPPGGLRN